MKADRDIEKLAEPFKSRVKRFLSECKEVFVTEAYRTTERQEWLYASGRSRSGPIITWTLNSKHSEGRAIDVAFHGPELYPKDFNKWRKVADVAKKHKVLWGWDLWGQDKPHFQNSEEIPDKDTQEFLNYEKMTPEQKQLAEAHIYSFKNCFNFGTKKMQELVSKQVKEWKDLLDEGK